MLMDNLKVYLLQADIIWNNVAENRARYENIIKTLKSPDLVVLPEMFLTGFDTDIPKNPENMCGKSIKWFKNTAKEYDTALMGSIIIEENGNYYNRMIFSDRGSKVNYYDKHYLFVLSAEHKNFTPGHSKVIFETRGWKILPQICYDLRFPEFCRNDSNYDILVYSANWPAVRIEHWEIMLRSRAVENQCYALGCNRVGTDKNNVIYNGNSMVVGPMGRILVRGYEKEYVLEHTLSKRLLEEIRTDLPFLKDIKPCPIHEH